MAIKRSDNRTAPVFGCEDCLTTGGVWVHLRQCQTCGHIGCCNSSNMKHALLHFERTGHPEVQSIEPGENWIWNYAKEEIHGPTG